MKYKKRKKALIRHPCFNLLAQYKFKCLLVVSQILHDVCHLQWWVCSSALWSPLALAPPLSPKGHWMFFPQRITFPRQPLSWACWFSWEVRLLWPFSRFAGRQTSCPSSKVTPWLHDTNAPPLGKLILNKWERTDWFYLEDIIILCQPHWLISFGVMYWHVHLVFFRP